MQCWINVLTRYYINPMKQRPEPLPTYDANIAIQALAEALSALKGSAEIRAFLEDLCTPAELEAIADRWRVVPLLINQVPYREIHDRTGVSVTTVGRIARCLGLGSGGYRLAAERVLSGTDPLAH